MRHVPRAMFLVSYRVYKVSIDVTGAQAVFRSPPTTALHTFYRHVLPSTNVCLRSIVCFREIE